MSHEQVGVPQFAQDRFAAAYNNTPHFRGHFVEFIPLILAFLQFLQGCMNKEEMVVRKIRRGKRYAKNTAMGVVREAHPEVPQDQQQVLAENLVDQWQDAPEEEIREMVALSKQVRVD